MLMLCCQAAHWCPTIEMRCRSVSNVERGQCQSRSIRLGTPEPVIADARGSGAAGRSHTDRVMRGKTWQRKLDGRIVTQTVSATRGEVVT